MTNSKQLAGLIGPTLIVLSISEAINSHIWINVSPAQTYLAGSLWLVAGLSIIRIHNHWKSGWHLLITLIGWFAFLGGAGRMFFPEPAQQGAQNTSVVLALQMVLLAVGIILSYKGYRHEKISQ